MKKVVFAIAMLVGAYSANAQAMNNSKYEDNTSSDVASVHHTNEFSKTEMTESGHIVTFNALPLTKKTIRAIVTDAAGEVVAEKRINPTENTVDIHKVNKSGIYFVTLMYKNKSQKAFVLHL